MSSAAAPSPTESVEDHLVDSKQSEIQYTQQFHQASSVARNPLTAMFSKNTKLHADAVTDYEQHFQKAGGKCEVDDQVEETAVQQRRSAYKRVTNTFYNLVTDFYEYGWGKSFHFSQMYPGEPFAQSIARHEHYLAGMLNARPGMRLLDVGCGIGGPAREIIQFCNVHVTGLNNNDYQLERASVLAKRANLSEQWTGVKGDFMCMELPLDSFDGVYAVEATLHAPDLAGVYGEVFKVLKPGGRFAFYEWCMTSAYDPDNAEHCRIRRGIEVGNGISRLVGQEDVLIALNKVGFEVEFEEVLGLNAEVPWYTPLNGNLRSNFATSKFGLFCTDKLCLIAETLRIAPKGTRKVSQLLRDTLPDLTAGGKLGIFTPMYLIVARKPVSQP